MSTQSKGKQAHPSGESRGAGHHKQKPRAAASPLAKLLLKFRRQSTAQNGVEPVVTSVTLPAEPDSAPQSEKELKPRKKPRRRKPLYRRWWAWALLGTGVTVGGGAIAVAWGIRYIESTLPDTSIVYSFVRDGTLTIKAADARILMQRGPATRENLTLEQIPPLVAQAFIAAEDERFYQHEGIDYQGIGRATLANIMARDVVEGGSTITQQLARIVFLNQERTLQRKAQEIFLARKLERDMSKQQILERYLNLVYLGSGAYGVADASWVYFNKPLNKLTLAEIATIAGLAPAPSVFSPIVNPEVGLQRRNLVLYRLQESGYITAVEAATESSKPLKVDRTRPRRLLAEAPHFTSYIEQELPKYVPPEVLEAGGLTVETTLRLDWQKIAERVVRETVERNGRWQNFSEASLVAIDPRNGEIRAMVGGKEFTPKNQFNRATQAQRQPGSTFKMFVYATAIGAGFSPYKYYQDAPYKIAGYQPQNFSKKHRGSMSMLDALTYSTNVVAVKVLVSVGFDPIIETAKKMGIRSELHPTYSLALGASEVNLVELASAYGTLATQGLHAEAHGIRRIFDRGGNLIYEANIKPERAIDKDTANIMTWMLQSVVNRGTGRPAQIGRPVAGKTGTSDKSRDLWFVGYIPQLVTGIWLGNDNNRPTWGASTTAAATWRSFMIEAAKSLKSEKFASPPGNLKVPRANIKAKPVKPGRTVSGKVTAKRNTNPKRNTRQNRSASPVQKAPSSAVPAPAPQLSMDEVLDPGAVPGAPPAAPVSTPAPAGGQPSSSPPASTGTSSPAPAAPAPAAPAPAAPAPAPAAPAPAPAAPAPAAPAPAAPAPAPAAPAPAPAAPAPAPAAPAPAPAAPAPAPQE